MWALDVAVPADTGAYRRCFTWERLAEVPWREVRAVVHLAGKVHDTRNTSDEQSYFDINTGLTQTVLEAWRRGMAEKDATRGRELERIFILFSSVKAAADTVEGTLTEEMATLPQTPYGRSKLAAERLLLPRPLPRPPSGRGDEDKSGGGGEAVAGVATDGYRDDARDNAALVDGVKGYILRPCMIHGPGNKGNLNLLYGVVRRGLPWPLGAYENRRSFTSVGNICAVVEGLLEGKAAAGIYQVADDEALATNELITLMASVTGRKERILKVPRRLVSAAARLGDALHLPLNSERLKKLTESYVVSNAKIKRALGWDKMPVAARDGLGRTLESFGA